MLGGDTNSADGDVRRNGYKLDFGKYACLGNYIKNNFTYIGLRGDGAPQWRSGSGPYCN
ncbi:hypothetical protein AB0C70_17660 [Streptomyces sp. NPDC048564]|uniref:hypothetical protein n=1 Tax=Streptomyces sp. NPDC048564 TaxID=3155760 RepID=UPI0034216C6D